MFLKLCHVKRRITVYKAESVSIVLNESKELRLWKLNYDYVCQKAGAFSASSLG
jgi:hypothetical protein